MGLLDRILNRRGGTDRRATTSALALVEPQPAVDVVLLRGDHDLEVVGESHYGEQAARPESVDDLRNRVIAYQTKLTTPVSASSA